MCYTVGAGYRLPGYPCDFCEKTSNMVEFQGRVQLKQRSFSSPFWCFLMHLTGQEPLNWERWEVRMSLKKDNLFSLKHQKKSAFLNFFFFFLEGKNNDIGPYLTSMRRCSWRLHLQGTLQNKPAYAISLWMIITCGSHLPNYQNLYLRRQKSESWNH